MTRRRRRWLIGLFVVFVVLPAAFVITMRLKRTGHEPPVLVRGQTFRLRNFFSEIYGARVGDKVVLFDAGIDTEGGPLDALLGALHATRDDVTDVFLTHGHFDHVAAAPLCKKARIHVGQEDEDLLTRRVPLTPAGARWFERILPVPPMKPTDLFTGRAELSVGDQKLLVIPLAGHTAGSYVMLFDGVLIAGDSMQISDGKLDFAIASFSQDPAGNKRNLAGLKAALAGAPVEVVCTGHQGCTAPGEAPKLLDDLIARAGS